MGLISSLWGKISEPRVISLLMFVQYVVLAVGGYAALISPPATIEGEIGVYSMYMLAGLLAFGGTVGAVTVLPGVWWLERIAVLSVAIAAFIYGGVVTWLNISQSGNRMLQLSFIAAVLILQAVRWHRIHQRPYDPARTTI